MRSIKEKFPNVTGLITIDLLSIIVSFATSILMIRTSPVFFAGYLKLIAWISVGNILINVPFNLFGKNLIENNNIKFEDTIFWRFGISAVFMLILCFVNFDIFNVFGSASIILAEILYSPWFSKEKNIFHLDKEFILFTRIFQFLFLLLLWFYFPIDFGFVVSNFVTSLVIIVYIFVKYSILEMKWTRSILLRMFLIYRHLPEIISNQLYLVIPRLFVASTGSIGTILKYESYEKILSIARTAINPIYYARLNSTINLSSKELKLGICGILILMLLILPIIDDLVYYLYHIEWESYVSALISLHVLFLIINVVLFQSFVMKSHLHRIYRLAVQLGFGIFLLVLLICSLVFCDTMLIVLSAVILSELAVFVVYFIKIKEWKF